ncbi:MAG TPA: flagellar filament capping protein FliD, partial [Candidatus Kapabacteria bacterium]|nr:flagellar filament capping protein FliD [Candidatus Kapabacteria bacterium]
MDLGVSGLASGFDWRTFVDQMVEVERAPQRTLLMEQGQIETRKNAYSSIKTQLAVFQNRITALKDPALFDSRSSQVSDEDLASVTASAGAPLGKFTFNFTQLATAARLSGATNIGAPINAANDVSSLVLSDAGFSTAVTAGTFTVNGKQITIATMDTLGQVFDKISTATGGTVTAAYDSASDSITLSSAAEIVLGSATDSSNFLRVAKLYNNSTGTVTSAASLGGINRAATLTDGTFATAINDGGAGAGSFRINGVEITFSATADSLNNVLTRINNSDAGVLASYDQVNDRIVLTNKDTGDMGIHVEDVTGNFAAATGLIGGTLERGNNLLYTVNDGGTLVSQSNVITEESSGIAGLNVTALDEGSVTISVTSDTEKIKSAIQGFIEDYNKVQGLLDANTTSATDDKGKVTAGTLASESDASEIASELRSLAYGVISTLAAEMNQLADIGIETNGDNNNLTLKDEDLLDAALATNLNGLRNLFT